MSWVRPDAKTDLLLRHEQGHFDITEIFARKKAKQLVGESESATAGGGTPAENDKEALEKTTEKIEQKVMEICVAIFEEENDMQEAYDKQTKHGTDDNQQKKWDGKIKKMLDKK